MRISLCSRAQDGHRAWLCHRNDHALAVHDALSSLPPQAPLAQATSSTRTNDTNLYKTSYKGGSCVVIAVYIDNCLVMPSSPKALGCFATEYAKHYTITGGKEVGS